MSIVEWDVPFDLVTPEGTLEFNVGAADIYRLRKEGCQAVAQIRATKDNIPQFSGSILHKRFKTGYEVQLQLVYWDTCADTACDGTAVQMHDLLMKHLESILDADGRLIWEPTGLATRFFESIRWLGEVTTDAQTGVLTVGFRVDSPFPYALDFTQNTNTFDDTDTLVNGGSAEMFPVIQVYAGSSACPGFVLTNLDNLDDQGVAKEIVFDADLPGAANIPAGQYIEFDTFRNTVYLNGDGANYKPGIDVEESDFWGLVVGSNEITIDGDGTNPAPTVVILWQNAWA